MVAEFNKEVLSEDAHGFRPERWLESEDNYHAMNKAMMVFQCWHEKLSPKACE